MKPGRWVTALFQLSHPIISLPSSISPVIIKIFSIRALLESCKALKIRTFEKCRIQSLNFLLIGFLFLEMRFSSENFQNSSKKLNFFSTIIIVLLKVRKRPSEVLAARIKNWTFQQLVSTKRISTRIPGVKFCGLRSIVHFRARMCSGKKRSPLRNLPYCGKATFRK